ncbi:MAG: M3 family metallopeptidase [Leptonema sp. (in: bacteria)]
MQVLDRTNPLFDLKPENSIDLLKLIENQGKDFLPALEYYKSIAFRRLESIKEIQNPDFQNTILALENSDQEIRECASSYYVLFSAECTEGIQKIASEISSFLANFSNDVFLDEDLFKKIDFVYKNQTGIKTQEDKRLTESYWRNFKRNGALLDGIKKRRLREIDEELSKLSPKFAENVLKSTNAFELHITNQTDLDGLPENLIEQGSINAESRKKEGWIFTLQYPEYISFITYCKNRDLRKKMYVAYRSRGLEPEYNNLPIIKRILELRYERANLLGYRNHCEYVLEERMAKTPEKVMNFLEELYQNSYPKAIKELNDLKEWIRIHLKEDIELQPWDLRFYSEQYKKFLYGIDQEMLRPYFPLESVLEGMFLVANKLYNLEFIKDETRKSYHKDVRIYKVYDDQNDLGLFYIDLFPRETKKSGAWMATIREQGLFLDQIVRPEISIVCNFTKPTKEKPSLLTYEEVKTLFHEFGHSLHGLFSNVKYRSLAGTNVYWDFVELPSQIMENWVKEKETLDLFARHYKTREKIPEEILKKLKEAENFQAGIQFLTQLNYGFLDMLFHLENPEKIQDILEFERKVTEKTRLFEETEKISISTSFSHIFAGGYSSGYYSYKWAEVLEADAFEFFKEKGIFNQEISRKFRKWILEKGNTEDPMDLYIKFRGREPKVEALLRKAGLLDPN